jgi:membrane-bound metal-dependent hydrolase YbcI (DUF457 family)
MPIRAQWRQHLPKLALLALLGNLPDIDFFFQLGVHANELHRGFTHSLAAAVAVSLGLSCLWRITPGFWRSAFLYFTAYGSHLVLDLCSGSKLGWSHAGYGIPLFWPWRQEFSSPLVLVFGVRHQNLQALFSLDNVWSCTYELMVFGAITLIFFALWKQKLNPRTIQRAPAAVVRPTMELSSRK